MNKKNKQTNIQQTQPTEEMDGEKEVTKITNAMHYSFLNIALFLYHRIEFFFSLNVFYAEIHLYFCFCCAH